VDIQLFLVNTFTRKVFHGQALAVCVLPDTVNDELLQAIAIENHLPETTFIQQVDRNWQVRWFNRNGEIFSSGHGLLAAAHVIFNFMRYKKPSLPLRTAVGVTNVQRNQERLYFDYPILPYPIEELSPFDFSHVKTPPNFAWQLGPDVLFYYEHPSQVEQVHVNREFYRHQHNGALILSSVSEDADFYVRCFFANQDYCEETATAAIYPRLAHFWSQKLNKTKLIAEQGLLRRSEIICELNDERLQIGGYCCCFYQGQLLF
jgi:predicted PhzF superfamily epimerase YddE/YHI9